MIIFLTSSAISPLIILGPVSLFFNVFEKTIRCLSGNASEEVIRYTIGENNPTKTSPIYTNPIEINENTTVRAQIFLENYLPSSISIKSYILKYR